MLFTQAQRSYMQRAEMHEVSPDDVLQDELERIGCLGNMEIGPDFVDPEEFEVEVSEYRPISEEAQNDVEFAAMQYLEILETIRMYRARIAVIDLPDEFLCGHVRDKLEAIAEQSNRDTCREFVFEAYIRRAVREVLEADGIRLENPLFQAIKIELALKYSNDVLP